MRIVYEAPEMLSIMSRTFDNLIGGAEICVNEIQHDETNGIVKIPMNRKERIEQTKKGCLLGWARPRYKAGSKRFPSLLIVRDVVEFKIYIDDLLITDCGSCFEVLFGLHIKNNELYLCSVEEASGKTLCEVILKVRSFNLELFDREKVL